MMKLYLLILMICLHSFSQEVIAQQSPPILCDDDTNPACVRENSLAMQKHVEQLVNKILETLPANKADTFRDEQEKWRISTWNKCVNELGTYINYSGGKYQANACITHEYLQRTNYLNANY